jgi:hypothetical protein
MTESEFVLSRVQRDDILNALKAIERQIKQGISRSDWQALYVIGTNLTIIRANLTNVPRTSPH